jgi:hypothetical protein
MLCFGVILRQGGQIWRWATVVLLAFDGAHASRLGGFFGNASGLFVMWRI